MTLDWRTLLEEATSAELLPRADVADVIEAVESLRARRNLGVPSAKPLVFPSGRCALLGEEIARLDNPAEVGAAISVLERPDRVIALARDAAYGGDGRAVALVGVRLLDGAAIGAILTIEQARPLKGRPPEFSAMTVTCSSDWDVFDGFPRLLEVLWIEAGAAGREIRQPPRPRPRDAVWLGEPGSARPDDWQERVRALFAVRGIRIEVIRDPQNNFRSARDKVIANGRELLVAVGGDSLSSACSAIVAEFDGRHSEHGAVVVEERDGADVLDLVRIEVEDRVNSVVARPDAKPTVADVIQDAVTVYAVVIDIWESALASAKGSRYPRPSELEDVLRAIHDLALAYAASLKPQANPMGPWEAWFEARGLDFHPFDSEATMNMYGDARTFSKGDRTLTFQKHFTLGGGGGAIQVYFEVDADGAREFALAETDADRKAFVVVGYCGTHLPYKSQRT